MKQAILKKMILIRPLAILCLLPLLSSCYVPDDFICEIRIGQTGDYSLTYNGTLTWAPLVLDIHDNKLSPDQIQQFGDSVISELTRINEFSEVTPISPGKVRVKYQKQGRFTTPQQVSFPRSGAEVLAMLLKLDGTLHIWATAKPKMADIQRLDAAGITSHGRLRIITNLDVLKTNATGTGQQMPGYPGWYIFDWTIGSLGQPPPALVARLFPEGHLKPPQFGQ